MSLAVECEAKLKQKGNYAEIRAFFYQKHNNFT